MYLLRLPKPRLPITPHLLMIPLMFLHTTRVIKPFPANGANVGRFSRVRPHVNCQIPLQSETLTTIRTRVRSFPTMSPQMIRQM